MAVVAPNRNGRHRLNFMSSLADETPTSICNIEALEYKNNFKRLREQLTKRLFKEFNQTIFNNILNADLPVLWDTKMKSKAGSTQCHWRRNSAGVLFRTSTIRLCPKVLDTTGRLQKTLLHELCHAAAWKEDKNAKGHGQCWKHWTAKALEIYPELENIPVLHSYDIHCKYTYKCTRCGNSNHRHSKSIDVTKRNCNRCSGKYQIIINRKNKHGVVSAPTRKGNKFALFVKEKYASVKEGKTHGQVMKLLAAMFSKRNDDKIIGSDDSSSNLD